MLIEYPTSFPLEAMNLVLDMLRGNFHDARYDVQVADTVLMYALGQMLPAPVSVPVEAAATVTAEAVNADAIKQVELAIAAHNGNFHAGIGALNWLAVAEAVLGLLQQILAKH